MWAIVYAPDPQNSEEDLTWSARPCGSEPGTSDAVEMPVPAVSHILIFGPPNEAWTQKISCPSAIPADVSMNAITQSVDPKRLILSLSPLILGGATPAIAVDLNIMHYGLDG
jgi:hypothetical protein